MAQVLPLKKTRLFNVSNVSVALSQSGDLSSAQEALHEAHAHELPEASLDTALPGQPGAAGVAGSGRSNAEEEGMLATLTQRITALEAGGSCMRYMH
eukprot:1161866-Pelagomonas_calceolata.AAC.6